MQLSYQTIPVARFLLITEAINILHATEDTSE